jgi:hypothetical protein
MVSRPPWGMLMPRSRAAGQDRQGVGLLARGAAGHPEAELPAGAAGQHIRQVGLGEGFHRLGIAEEAGDPDQQLAVERHRLAGVVLQKAHVIVQALDLVHHHPALQAPLDGAGLVVGEVHLGAVAEDGEDARQRVLVTHQRLGPLLQGGGGVLDVGGQLHGHLVGRQDEVGHAGGDGGPGQTTWKGSCLYSCSGERRRWIWWVEVTRIAPPRSGRAST